MRRERGLSGRLSCGLHWLSCDARRADRDEPALLALLIHDQTEAVDGLTADLEQLLEQIAVFQQHACCQR